MQDEPQQPRQSITLTTEARLAVMQMVSHGALTVAEAEQRIKDMEAGIVPIPVSPH